MFLRVLKVALLIGVFLSSLMLVLAKILPPSRIIIILMLYAIVLSSVISGMVIYFEFNVKPRRQLKKIEKVVDELKRLKDVMNERMNIFSKANYSKHQTYLLIEQSLSKLEEKIEKIEKEVMDKSMC